VTGSGGGALAITLVENAAPTTTAPAPLSTSRRDTFPDLILRLLSADPFIGDAGTPRVTFYSDRMP